MSAAELQAPEEALKINIRPATGDDVPWIYRSWFNNFREKGSCSGNFHGVGSCAMRVRGHVFHKHYRALVLRLTSRPGVMTIVACPEGAEGQILGWMCGERLNEGELALHYAHVKSEWRRKGIGRALVTAMGLRESDVVHYSHHTKLTWRNEQGVFESSPLRAILPVSWVFNPYIL